MFFFFGGAGAPARGNVTAALTKSPGGPLEGTQGIHRQSTPKP